MRFTSRAGWPRGLWPWRGEGNKRKRCPQLPDKLPAPWINGTQIRQYGDWHSFRDDCKRVFDERLCLVCGLVIEGTVVLPAMSGEKACSGGGAHPRCALLAVTRCPHLVEVSERGDDQVVAWRYDGEGVGFDYPEDDSFGCGETIWDEATPLTVAELRELVKA